MPEPTIEQLKAQAYDLLAEHTRLTNEAGQIAERINAIGVQINEKSSKETVDK